ncbi:MAG: prepilin-type N-terminal cleavage/methylation domain-containing protein [Rhodothermales bacterium]|nr:prepilin-type N-terminal cleavage/methylation domain-containing protein [Rhodothermales bacterium]
MTNDAGFTLVELLVAMALTLVSVTLAGSAYLFLSRAVNGWQEDVRLANAFHTTLTRLSDDLYDAVAVYRRADSTVALVRVDGDTVAYSWRDGALRRLDHPMHDFTTVLGVTFDLAADSSGGAPGFEAHLALAGRRRVLETTTRVNRRHPSPWPP